MYLRHRPDNGVLYDLYQRHPEFRPFAENKAILEGLSSALGEDIIMFTNSLIYKPLGKNNAVPWHQDFGKLDNKSDKYIVWMPLDDSRRENGCVKIIPDFHKLGQLQHFSVAYETHHDRIMPELVDEKQAVYVELDAGDVLIFNMNMIHSSEEVHTTKPRRAYRVAYQGFYPQSVPRGGALVMRGGKPTSLGKRFPNPYVPKQDTKSVPQRVLNRIGRYLSSV